MVDTDIRPAYVDVAEVCRDWGCSRSKGYAIIKQLSGQMKSENPRLLTMSGKNQSYLLRRSLYEEIGMERVIKKGSCANKSPGRIYCYMHRSQGEHSIKKCPLSRKEMMKRCLF